MANIGLKNAKYNQIDYTTNKYKTLTDAKVPTLGKLIDAKIAPENNNAELYADDGLAESDYSFKKGTLNLTLADVEESIAAEVLGNDIKETEVTENVNDTAPEIGYGHIVTKIINKVKKYKVEFLPRIKVTKITTDAKTKGESVEFGTATVEATVMALESAINGMAVGDWKKVKTFASLEEAETYLNGLLTPVT